MKALNTLKLYCNNPFPHYHKVKVLMGQAAGSSEAEHHYNIANVVQYMEGLVIGSRFPTTQLPSGSPLALSESLHVWSDNPPSFALSTSKTPSTPLVQSQALSSSSACCFEPERHASRDHSRMPPLCPSPASNHGLQWPYPSPASACWMPQSAPVTPSSTFLSQRHPASSHASKSQPPDSAHQTIQMPLGLEPHTRNHQPSMCGRMGDDPAIQDDSSHLESEGSSSAALVGVVGAMDHLVSNIRPPYETTKETMKIVAAECSLSEEERAILSIYYGKHMTEAAALSLMGSSLRRAVFRKVLEGLPSDFYMNK
jgi:hypothetical protein